MGSSIVYLTYSASAHATFARTTRAGHFREVQRPFFVRLEYQNKLEQSCILGAQKPGRSRSVGLQKSAGLLLSQTNFAFILLYNRTMQAPGIFRAASHTQAALRVLFVRHGETDANRAFAKQAATSKSASASTSKSASASTSKSASAFTSASTSTSSRAVGTNADLREPVEHAEEAVSKSFEEPALTARGIEQAQAVAAVLASVRIDEVLCSSLLRAQSTARPLTLARGLPLTVDPSWAEFDSKRETLEEFEDRTTYLWTALVQRACAQKTQSAGAALSLEPLTIVIYTHSLLLSALLGSSPKPAHVPRSAGAPAGSSAIGAPSSALEFQTQVHFPNASISVVDFCADGSAHVVLVASTAHLPLCMLSDPHPLVAALRLPTPFDSSASATHTSTESASVDSAKST